VIYIVEDDNSIRELVAYTLENSGFEAVGCADGTAFFELLDPERAQLVLLDIMLPGEDGIGILRRLRADTATRELPVIMVTARGSEFDKVTGLDAGADDYIAKPFGMMELLARIRAVLRRRPPARDGALTVGDVILYPREHRVTADGEEVLLTFKEFELLQFLLERRGAAIGRDEILESVWGYISDIETRTVDVHIRTLRQKLGKSGDVIETVRGVGYRIGGEA
jgi:two-component system alkaline phosphatase synthesis response regulator PhoP